MTVDYSNLPIGTADSPGPAVTAVRGVQAGTAGPRHLVHPLRLVDGPHGSKVLATVEQDTLEEVVQSVKLILATERGERYRDAPNFGVDELLTGDPVNTSAAAATLAELEPRALVTFTSGSVDGEGRQVIRADVALVEGAADVSPSLDR
jgi:phage baseplate assembly protein W